ncbi:MAG: hypothetical protein ACUVTM_01140 [Candidatus Bathyarchaeia archaeon]
MPTVTLKLYTLFRTVAGNDKIEQEAPPGSTILNVLCLVAERLGPRFRDLVWDRETGRVLPFLVGVRGRIEPSTGRVLDTHVDNGDVIILMDPVGRGFERLLDHSHYVNS